MARTTLLLICCIAMLCTVTKAQHQPLKYVSGQSLEEFSLPANIKSDKRVLSVKIDPSGDYIALGSLDKTLKVFSLTSGDQKWALDGPEFEPISSTSLPSSNPLLISAQNAWAGGRIFLVNWSTGENLGNLRPYAGGRNALDFFGAAGTSKLAWGGPEGKVFEYNFTENKLETTTGYDHHQGKVYTVAYGPYGNLFSSGQDGRVVKRKADDQPEEILKFENPVLAMGINLYIRGTEGNERYLAAGDNRGNFRVKDLNTGAIVYTSTLDSECKAIRFHPTDPNLVVAISKQNLYLIDFKKNQVLKKVNVQEDLWSLDISMNGSMIALGLESGKPKVYRFSN